VLTADAEFDVGANGLGLLDADLHELADAASVDGLEWVTGQDFAVLVHAHELIGVTFMEQNQPALYAPLLDNVSTIEVRDALRISPEY
jgi:hypothetical protein